MGRDQDMAEEMAAHLEAQTRANIAAGMTPAEAQRTARLRFGPVEAIKDSCREQRRWAWLEQIGRDLRFGLRLLRASPAFTAVVVLTLALGIGVNTAMFSVIDGVLLRPLPYPSPERLVRLLERTRTGTSAVNHTNFADWQQRQTVFSALGLWRPGSFNLTIAGQAQRVDAAQLSHEIFTALGVQPALGRVFRAEEDRTGAPRVVVASHQFWQNQLGGDVARVGGRLMLDGEAYTLIGVMPPGFAFSGQASLWEPLGPRLPAWNNRLRRMGLRALGRLAPGVDLATARAAMDEISARLAVAHPQSNQDIGADLVPLASSQHGSLRRPLWMLLGAAGLVLLIACANVANLLLARAVSRQRELALRVALGAGRRRLMAQLLTEALLLALAGGVAGLLVAWATLQLVRRVAAGFLPSGASFGLDGRVLAFSAVLAVVTALAFGHAPLWRRRESLPGGLHRGHPAETRALSALVVGQIALTLVLLTAAGLLLRSFHQLQAVDAGFAADGVLSFRVTLPDRGYETPERRIAFFDGLLGQLRALPGVTAASVSSQIPFDARGTDACLVPADGPMPPLHQCPSTELHFIDGDYFRTMGIPLRRGRSFDTRDVGAPLRAVIVDETLAQRFWPGGDALGRVLTFPVAPDPREQPPRMTVVGVVGQVKLDRLGEPQTRGQAYFPHRQRAFQSGLTVVIRAAGAPEALVPAARRVVQALDPQLPLSEIRTLGALRASNMATERLTLALVGGFAALALTLALVGLYGLASYSVEQRQAEIGVRVALGARRGQILSSILRQGLRLAALGITLGLIAAVAISQLLATLLFEITPTDPLTLTTVSALVLTVALLACLLPAHRALRIQPLRALRHE